MVVGLQVRACAWRQLAKVSKVGLVIPTLFLFFSMSSTLLAQSLHDTLTAYLQRVAPRARVSLSVKSLTNTSIIFNHRADERVPSASVIKLPVMLEMMERVKAGTLNLDGIHTLLKSEKTGGSGVLAMYPDDSRISYAELLRLMMVYSDNAATNILIRQLSREAINQRMRTIGLTESQLNRVMMDTLAARQGRENYVTAQEMNTLLEKIYRNQVTTPALCQRMLDILKQNTNTDKIPRLIPRSTLIAHKTGELPYVQGDAGIVYAREPFLISAFVQGTSTPEAERIISELAFISYTYFSR